jgi:hypothetical protein
MESGLISPLITFKSVLLPEPLAPHRAVRDWLVRVNDTPSRISLSPKARRTSRT